MTEYESRISNLRNLDIDDIIKVVREIVPPYRNAIDLHKSLNHGRSVLQSEDHCNAY